MTEYLIYFNQQWVGDHTEEWFLAAWPLGMAVVHEMEAAGVLVFAGGLGRTGPAYRRRDQRHLVVTDGPYVETTEFLGGLRRSSTSPDHETARMWAGKVAEGCGWPQEVRQFKSMPRNSRSPPSLLLPPPPIATPGGGAPTPSTSRDKAAMGLGDHTEERSAVAARSPRPALTHEGRPRRTLRRRTGPRQPCPRGRCHPPAARWSSPRGGKSRPPSSRPASPSWTSPTTSPPRKGRRAGRGGRVAEQVRIINTPPPPPPPPPPPSSPPLSSPPPLLPFPPPPLPPLAAFL